MEMRILGKYPYIFGFCEYIFLILKLTLANRNNREIDRKKEKNENHEFKIISQTNICVITLLSSVLDTHLYLRYT